MKVARRVLRGAFSVYGALPNPPLLYKGVPIFKWLSILLELPIEAVLPFLDDTLLGQLEYTDRFFIEFFGIRFIEFGLTFILFSLFIKLALAPFHL
jgi:hypothetical protein